MEGPDDAYVLRRSFAIVGAVATVIYFLQPWRTCPDDDVPAGCSMLPHDAAIMTAAMFVALSAAAVAIAGAASQRRTYS